MLTPPLGLRVRISELERLWLECACAYEVFDDPLMEDHLWDNLGQELLARRAQLSAFFCRAVGFPWPFPEPEPGENPLKTASGIDWRKGLPLLVEEGLRKERPVRKAMWGARIRYIAEEAYKRDTGRLFDDAVVEFLVRE